MRTMLAAILVAALLGACGSQRVITRTVNGTGASASTGNSGPAVIRDDARCFHGRDMLNNAPCTPAPSPARKLHRAKPKPAPVWTVTQTQTVEVPVPAPVHHVTHDYAATYPVTFEASFDVQCEDVGGNASGCECALKHIENAVPYTAVLKATHAILTGDPPQWYTSAEQSCTGGY